MPPDRKINRREFLRSALTVGAATLVACGKPDLVPAESSSEQATPAGAPTARATEVKPANTPMPQVTPRASPAPESSPTGPVNSELNYPPELQEIAWKEFEASYEDWMATYTTTDGTASDQLRATWRDDPGSDPSPFGTPSEAQSWALQLAAMADDFDSAQELLNYVTDPSHQNKNGLMPWLLSPQGEPVFNPDINRPDTGSATESEVNIIESLIIAVRKGLEIDKTIISGRLQAVRVHQIYQHMVLPGDSWGEDHDVFSPVHWSGIHGETFAQYTGDNFWPSVNHDHDHRVDLIHQNLGGASTGLVPAYSTPDGYSLASQMRESADLFSWRACRYPYNLARHFLNGTDTAHTRNQLILLNKFFQAIGPDKIVTSYTLDGQAMSDETDNAAFISAAACASTVSSDSEYRRQILTKLIDTQNHDYFADSLRMLALATLSGRYRPAA